MTHFEKLLFCSGGILKKIQVLLKSVLFDLHVHNFVHMKTSLHACWVHAHDCACNLLSPENYRSTKPSK